MKISICAVLSVIVAEFLGYWLHRLLHSDTLRVLSRSHMKHHLVLYGPRQNQRPSSDYIDATTGQIALGNIGLEWLMPSGILLAGSVAFFCLLGIRPLYQFVYVVVVLAWSFLSFSYLHDRMHEKGSWIETNRWTRRWFLNARKLHDVHHRTLRDDGRMDKNFGIGFFFFDRLFGTLARHQRPFNHRGYDAAKRRYDDLINQGLRRQSSIQSEMQSSLKRANSLSSEHNS
jgi:sterol desaturase/sphingolipid hydroxylase (fatty acid hydroxylase superfamily)